ncbi:hypothetical protein JB92DRAFT_2833709 [Gautieria morchelliformis]|nr:hypothetical protein JB92DRAFT_2833709 [Gautieria morchelliformis]
MSLHVRPPGRRRGISHHSVCGGVRVSCLENRLMRARKQQRSVGAHQYGVCGDVIVPCCENRLVRAVSAGRDASGPNSRAGPVRRTAVNLQQNRWSEDRHQIPEPGTQRTNCKSYPPRTRYTPTSTYSLIKRLNPIARTMRMGEGGQKQLALSLLAAVDKCREGCAVPMQDVGWVGAIWRWAGPRNQQTKNKDTDSVKWGGGDGKSSSNEWGAWLNGDAQTCAVACVPTPTTATSPTVHVRHCTRAPAGYPGGSVRSRGTIAVYSTVECADGPTNPFSATTSSTEWALRPIIQPRVGEHTTHSVELMGASPDYASVECGSMHRRCAYEKHARRPHVTDVRAEKSRAEWKGIDDARQRLQSGCSGRISTQWQTRVGRHTGRSIDRLPGGAARQMRARNMMDGGGARRTQERVGLWRIRMRRRRAALAGEAWALEDLLVLGSSWLWDFGDGRWGKVAAGLAADGSRPSTHPRSSAAGETHAWGSEWRVLNGGRLASGSQWRELNGGWCTVTRFGGGNALAWQSCTRVYTGHMLLTCPKAKTLERSSKGGQTEEPEWNGEI